MCRLELDRDLVVRERDRERDRLLLSALFDELLVFRLLELRRLSARNNKMPKTNTRTAAAILKKSMSPADPTPVSPDLLDLPLEPLEDPLPPL